ncbi:hypothetical protein BCR33DRAFT_29595 [Rhizoclosmatium globosum]|uniref:RING-CH-type domain-containing protein n=1 Tax=Rhizoclosmatium globosum TaxID=329046 RepID=A0A1Y2AWS8_9FUNG|nr:hypothetical protein BCR33DRAFT_29595 [Rhizoclosmatium globosum]|eukprot:ORY27053.1 hypothetical protein BCR33DRAFT_29595 [Rhizoclosmatium globosum]
MTENETDQIACRICLSTEHTENLISPCRCKGSQLFVHRTCLLRWIRIKSSSPPHSIMTSDAKTKLISTHCQSCLFEYKLRRSGTWVGLRAYTNIVSWGVVLGGCLFAGWAIRSLSPLSALVPEERKALLNINISNQIYSFFQTKETNAGWLTG